MVEEMAWLRLKGVLPSELKTAVENAKKTMELTGIHGDVEYPGTGYSEDIHNVVRADFGNSSLNDTFYLEVLKQLVSVFRTWPSEIDRSGASG